MVTFTDNYTPRRGEYIFTIFLEYKLEYTDGSWKFDKSKIRACFLDEKINPKTPEWFGTKEEAERWAKERLEKYVNDLANEGKPVPRPADCDNGDVGPVICIKDITVHDPRIAYRQ